MDEMLSKTQLDNEAWRGAVFGHQESFQLIIIFLFVSNLTLLREFLLEALLLTKNWGTQKDLKILSINLFLEYSADNLFSTICILKN